MIKYIQLWIYIGSTNADSVIALAVWKCIILLVCVLISAHPCSVQWQGLAVISYQCHDMCSVTLIMSGVREYMLWPGRTWYLNIVL